MAIHRQNVSQTTQIFSRIMAVGLFCIGTISALAQEPAANTRHMVAMRDGVKLATDVYLPAGDGPFPVVLARSLYDIKAVGALGAIFRSQGMAFVIQQTRGYFDSEGEDEIFSNDGWGAHPDGVDCLKWVRSQTWCNGKVGTIGISALAISSQLLAGTGEPLDAQVMVVGASDFYGYLSYQGGVFRKHLVEEWVKQQGSDHMIDRYKAHPSDDEFWALRDADAQAERINAPGFHVGGWWDIFQQSTINHFVARQAKGGVGARGNQYLLIGPWLHGARKNPGDLVLRDNFNHDFMGDSLKFLRHHLLDQADLDLPVVRYYTIGDVEDPNAPGNEWRTADAWPPFETTETPLFLSSDNLLTYDESAVASGSVSFAYDPANPCPTLGGQNLMLPAGPFDQREVSVRPDVVRTATAPLETPVEITGRVKVRLFVSSDAPDTDFTAKLVDIYPDGREILMLDNIQRVKYRNGFGEPHPLPAGEIGEIEIDLWSISLIVNAGHRIGVQISSSNYPRFEKNPNTGADFLVEGEEMRVATNTVHFGPKYPSALILPIRPE